MISVEDVDELESQGGLFLFSSYWFMIRNLATNAKDIFLFTCPSFGLR